MEPAPGPASDDFRSNMAVGRLASRGSLADPFPNECMLPSLEGRSRVQELTLDRGPFREYALPFRLRRWSFWTASGFTSPLMLTLPLPLPLPLGQFVHRKVFPTEFLSLDLR